MKQTSTKLLFDRYNNYNFLASKRTIQEGLVINKQDLVKINCFTLMHEPFQLINSREKT